MILIRRGKWKLFPNYVNRSDGTTTVFARPSKVQAYLDKLLLDISEMEKSGVNAISLAAYFHLNYINVHPFDDTNGRTCRALVGLILQQHGLLPFSVSPDMKREYVESILKATETKDLRPLMNFIEKQQQSTLLHSFFCREHVLGIYVSRCRRRQIKS